MNLREYFGFDKPYFTINREERNFAAILYHALLIGDNLKRFLSRLGCTSPVIPAESGIYFEYAFIRDIWNSLAAGSLDRKRSYILDALQLRNTAALAAMSVKEFNSYFGVGVVSATHIQSPANWSLPKFAARFSDNDELLRVSCFKWCFNAKPDLVIHTSERTAICIEAKYASDEDKYPSSSALEKAIFRERGLERVSQRSIQEMIMRDMLGIDATHWFLIEKPFSRDRNANIITWRDAFACLDMQSMPHFVGEWIKRLDK